MDSILQGVHVKSPHILVRSECVVFLALSELMCEVYSVLSITFLRPIFRIFGQDLCLYTPHSQFS